MRGLAPFADQTSCIASAALHLMYETQYRETFFACIRLSAAMVEMQSDAEGNAVGDYI